MPEQRVDRITRGEKIAFGFVLVLAAGIAISALTQNPLRWELLYVLAAGSIMFIGERVVAELKKRWDLDEVDMDSQDETGSISEDVLKGVGLVGALVVLGELLKPPWWFWAAAFGGILFGIVRARGVHEICRSIKHWVDQCRHRSESGALAPERTWQAFLGLCAAIVGIYVVRGWPL